jgi:type I restriction enzyme, S subunit
VSELPNGWELARIADVTVDAVQEIPDDEEGFLYIDIASVDRDRKVVSAAQKLTGRVAPTRARKRVAAGDVLVSMTRPNLNAVALIGETYDGQIASTGFDVLRAVLVEPRWLFYIVRSRAFIERMSELVQGALYPAVRPGDVRGFEAPFAPLPEQERICDKLDEIFVRLNTCRDRLERIPGIIKAFRQSVLMAATSGELTSDWRAARGLPDGVGSFAFEDADVFGDYEYPISWASARLGEIASIEGGLTKDRKKQSSEYVEVPYLRVANVQRGYLDLSEIKTIRVPPERLDELLLQPGDILFNEGGDIDKLGRGWIWNGEIERCIFQNHVFRARLKDTEFSPEYFSWYGNSRGFDYFLAHGKQSTNLASINKSVLGGLPVAIPPAQEQAEIVARIHHLFGYADRVERRYTAVLNELEALPQVLLAKAFRGDLVPQDAQEESATIMLQRVSAERTRLLQERKLRKPTKKRRVPYMKSLADALADANDWMPAQDAFQRCGVVDGTETPLIEELYGELRELDKAGKLAVQSVKDEHGRKLYDRLKLQPGS